MSKSPGRGEVCRTVRGVYALMVAAVKLCQWIKCGEVPRGPDGFSCFEGGWGHVSRCWLVLNVMGILRYFWMVHDFDCVLVTSRR